MRSPTSGRLSPRDLAIIDSVRLLGQVSAGQLLRLHFADGSPASRGARTRRTMTRLVTRGAVVRLPQRWVGGYRGGSDGYVYQPPGSRSRSFLDHRVALTELYVQLVETARLGLFDLADFRAEPASYRRLGALELKPDAWLRLEHDGRGRQVFIELDRGTESAVQITAKLTTYAAAVRAWPADDDNFPLVLFVVCHDLPQREEQQVRLIARTIQRHPVPGLFAICPFGDAANYLVR
jgi:hypothetical protein